MSIDHIAMYFVDLERAKDFFEKYFAAKCIEVYLNEEINLKSYFLSFSEGAKLEIMNMPVLEDVEKSLSRTGYIHMAFSVGSKEKVDELTKRLKLDGYPIMSEPKTTSGGCYESSVIGLEGNLIEITL